MAAAGNGSPPLQHDAAPNYQKSGRLASLPQREEKQDDRERGQNGCDYKSGRRNFRAIMEIHFHSTGEAEQEKQQRGINQNYADTFFVVRFHQ